LIAQALRHVRHWRALHARFHCCERALPNRLRRFRCEPARRSWAHWRSSGWPWRRDWHLPGELHLAGRQQRDEQALRYLKTEQACDRANEESAG
jgi:hypothetical protein